MKQLCATCESTNVQEDTFTDTFNKRDKGNKLVIVSNLDGYFCNDCGAVTITAKQFAKNTKKVEKAYDE